MTDNPFVSIESKLLRLERQLLEMRDILTASPTPPPADDFLSLKQSAEFLGVARQTMYQNIKRIPHSKRFGKIFIRQSDLVAYLEDGAATHAKKGVKP